MVWLLVALAAVPLAAFAGYRVMVEVGAVRDFVQGEAERGDLPAIGASDGQELVIGGTASGEYVPDTGRYHDGTGAVLHELIVPADDRSVLRVTVAPEPGFTPRMRIVDATNDEVGSAAGMGEGLGEMWIELEDPAPGTYRVAVFDGPGSGGGTYTLRAQWTTPMADATDGGEIDLGTAAEGQLDDYEEVAYSLQVPAGQAGWVRLRATSADMDPVVHVFDGDGNRLGSDLVSEGEGVSTVDVELAAGTYHVVVGSWAGHPGTYRLDVAPWGGPT